MTTRKLIPPKIHPKDGRWYYVDRGKWKGLSRIDEGLRELYRRMALLTDHQPCNTMAAIFASYAEHGMSELRPATQKQYNYFMFGTDTRAGILTRVFGHTTPAEFDDSTIAQYLETRKKKGAAVSGNRERACLSSVFEYAMRNGMAKRNPCRGVRRNRERASTVRIKTSADLSAKMDQAPGHFAKVMQFAYLSGVREIDMIKMELAALTPDGIRYNESKTGKPAFIPWTLALRELVREILEARHVAMTRQNKNAKRPRVLPVHNNLFTNRFGKPITMWSVTSNIRRLDTDGWTFRSLRPKAQNDGADIGHGGSMFETYNKERKLRTVR